MDYRLLDIASNAYESYWLCGRCDRGLMLKTSAGANDVKT